MTIAIGCDRNGFDYKNRLVSYLTSKGIEVIDVGTKEYVPCDSPYYASKVGKLVSSGECSFGILICATGTGMVISANKIPGVMCGMGYGDEVTRLMREHNDANVIAFGQDHMGYKDVQRRVDIFISTSFSGLVHQAARIQQVKDLESGKDIELTPLFDQNWKLQEHK